MLSVWRILFLKFAWAPRTIELSNHYFGLDSPVFGSLAASMVNGGERAFYEVVKLFLSNAMARWMMDESMVQLLKINCSIVGISSVLKSESTRREEQVVRLGSKKQIKYTTKMSIVDQYRLRCTFQLCCVVVSYVRIFSTLSYRLGIKSKSK